MNDLRDIAAMLFHANRIEDSSIGYIQYSGDVFGWLVLTWYKDRGACDGAVFIQDDQHPQDLRLAMAEELIAIHTKRLMEERVKADAEYRELLTMLPGGNHRGLLGSCQT
jgi:hypothetical protein